MLKIRKTRFIPVFVLLLVVGVFAFVGVKAPIETNAAGYSKGPLPTTINLNDATEDQIRDY
mgnify:CR=1 FL=1